ISSILNVASMVVCWPVSSLENLSTSLSKRSSISLIVDFILSIVFRMLNYGYAYHELLLRFYGLGNRIHAIDAVNGSRYNSTRVARALSTGVKARYFRMLQSFFITWNTDRGGCTRLYAHQNSLIGIISLHFLTKKR